MPTAIAKTTLADEPSADVEILRRDLPAGNRFSDQRNFINRELSWLEFNRRVLEEAQDPDQLRGYLNLIFVSRCLERVGDHATNIAEDAVYAAAAEDIRHQGLVASA
jgi:hypothetical protein